MILLILLIPLIELISATDYCKLCSNGTHTMCQFKEGPADSCEEYKKFVLTDSEKQYIVDIHNDVRNHVASGQEARGALGYQPSASDMFMLEWDDELAEIAQRWADQCIAVNDTIQHDTCKRTERFDVGQNILTAITTDTDLPDLSTLILNWYKQVVNVIPSDVDHFVGVRRGKFLIGQYTQLVWGRTSYVGCGIAVFKDTFILNNDQYHHRLVCNYGPAGNVIGQVVYQRGVPCSRCPYGECDFQRVYLCRSHKLREEQAEKFIDEENDTLIPIKTPVITETKNTTALDTINTSICLDPSEINNTTETNYTVCDDGNVTDIVNVIPVVIVASTSIQNETFSNNDTAAAEDFFEIAELVSASESFTETEVKRLTHNELTVEPLIVNATESGTASEYYTSTDIEEIDPLSITEIEVTIENYMTTPFLDMLAVNLTFVSSPNPVIIGVVTSGTVSPDFMHRMDNNAARSYSPIEQPRAIPNGRSVVPSSDGDGLENRDRSFQIDNGVVLPHYCDKNCKTLKSSHGETQGRRLRTRKLYPRVLRQRDEIILPNNMRYRRARGSWHNGHCKCDSARLKLTLILLILPLFLSK